MIPYTVPIAVDKGRRVRLREPWFLGGLIVGRWTDLLHG